MTWSTNFLCKLCEDRGFVGEWIFKKTCPECRGNPDSLMPPPPKFPPPAPPKAVKKMKAKKHKWESGEAIQSTAAGSLDYLASVWFRNKSGDTSLALSVVSSRGIARGKRIAKARDTQ